MGYRHAVLSLSAVVLITPLAATGTAHADAVADNAAGVYNLEWQPDVPMAKWTFTPCDDDAPRCIAVNQYQLTDAQLKTPEFIGKAFWNVGAWTMVSDVKNLITCKASGEKFNFAATWSWEDATNAGSRSYIDPGLCGGDTTKGKDVTSKFTLKKIGSDAPAPASTPAPTPGPAPAPAPAPPAPAAAAEPAPAAETPAAEAAPTPTPAPGAAESTAPPPAA